MFNLQWKLGRDSYGEDAYYGNLFVGSILEHSFADRSWQAWYSSSPEGTSIGWYDTVDEAKAAVERTFLGGIPDAIGADTEQGAGGPTEDTSFGEGSPANEFPNSDDEPPYGGP